MIRSRYHLAHSAEPMNPVSSQVNTTVMIQILYRQQQKKLQPQLGKPVTYSEWTKP